MTIDDPKIISQMLEDDGYFSGDPQAFSIWTYVNNWNAVTFSVCYGEGHQRSLQASPDIHSPQLLWSAAGGMTELGRWILSDIKAGKWKR